jgi:hypothetical protein
LDLTDFEAARHPQRAVGNLRLEMTGDWYRDPWGWPEYEFILHGHLDWLTKRGNARDLRRVVKIDVPKENFGIRPAVIIEPVDRLLYQYLVDTLSKHLIGDLDPWGHGWRLRRSDPVAGLYSPSDFEWEKYRGHLKNNAIFADFGLKTDITACFSSIPVDRVCEDVLRRAGDNLITQRLVVMVQSLNDIQGRRGLAQRSTASSVLANMYLERLRYVLVDHIQQNSGSFFWGKIDRAPVLRWMDDLWLFGDDEAALRALQIDLQGAAREAGLELNMGKTKLLADEALWAAVTHVEHSAVDAAIKIPDMTPLEELIDQIIAAPEDADRTTIRFAMTRMRKTKNSTRLEKLIEVAPRMPQGADHLARAFRDFEVWRTHEDWFLEYVKSPWNKISWSLAQLGTMFPSLRAPSRSVKDQFIKFVLDQNEYLLLALGAQRLAAWEPRTAGDLLHEAVNAADHPQARRIIGLAAAAAGQESTFIRRVLGEYEENRQTLEMLESRNFAPFEPAADFGSA